MPSQHNPYRDQLVAFCAEAGWHPLLAAQILYQTAASLLVSQMGPEDGINQLDRLVAEFKEEMAEDPAWNLH